jgi:hypothetical protein
MGSNQHMTTSKSTMAVAKKASSYMGGTCPTNGLQGMNGYVFELLEVAKLML